jgi:hypothetical protein
MSSTTPMRLTLELRRDSDPLAGRIVDAEGERHEFVGWVGLASALAEVLEEQPDVPKEAPL